jgi:hypothetical protein
MVILTGVQRNEQAITIIWIFFFVIMAFIAVFLITRISAIRKKRRIANEKAEQEYQTLKECYSHLTPEKIDDCADDQLPSAVILECQRKEEEDEDHYYESLNEVEKTVYGIYQLNQNIGGNSGIRSFFMSPALSDYVDDIENCFERVGAYDIASLLKGAKHLYDVLENDAEDNEEGDYATYNFSDFTHEYKTLISGTNFNKKVISYIRLNKALFKGDER